MIKYNLKCQNNHEFESWFSNSEEFEKLNNLLITVNSKNCNSSKLNDFFKDLDQNFDKNNFTLTFTDSNNYEKTIKFQKPNCISEEIEKL